MRGEGEKINTHRIHTHRIPVTGPILPLQSGGVVGPCQVIGDVDAEELKTADSTVVPLMWIWACSLLSFLKSTINSFVFLTLRERSLSWHHNAGSLTTSPLADSSWLVIRPTTVVSSVNVMMKLVSYKANREYSRGLRTHPCVAPVLRDCCHSSQPVVCPSGSPRSSCRGCCTEHDQPLEALHDYRGDSQLSMSPSFKGKLKTIN